MKASTALQRIGLLNYGMEDISAYMGTREVEIVRTAVCDSDQCRKQAGFVYRKVQKDVKLSAKMCPDCDHALIWKSRYVVTGNAHVHIGKLEEATV